MSEQTHRSDPRILGRRTLQRDHRRLADLLRPGMRVLDVGCGTGAITAGIAKKVGPEGDVVGIDRDESLLALAKREHQSIGNLSFENRDVLSLNVDRRFDIVTAARVLQWISEPADAIRRMKRAAKTGGRLVVLDFNHEDNSWLPEPPAEFGRFYRAFLEWRAVNNWSNRMAERLPELFCAAGIEDVRVHVDDETAQRGDPDFFDAAAIWSHVMESLGPQIVAAEFLAEKDRFLAEKQYQRFVEITLQRQTLAMKTVEAVVG